MSSAVLNSRPSESKPPASMHLIFEFEGKEKEEKYEAVSPKVLVLNREYEERKYTIVFLCRAILQHGK